MDKKTIINDLEEAYEVLEEMGDGPNQTENVNFKELIAIKKAIDFIKK